jgi:hypothetical protein
MAEMALSPPQRGKRTDFTARFNRNQTTADFIRFFDSPLLIAHRANHNHRLVSSRSLADVAGELDNLRMTQQSTV